MEKETSNNSVYDTTIRMFFLFLIIAWCLLIISPFVSIMLWSLILGMALFPFHKTLSKKMGGRPKLASFLIVFSLLLVVVVPAGFIMGSLVEEVKELKVMYNEGTLTIPAPNEQVKDWPIVGDKLFEVWQSASTDVAQSILKYKDQLRDIGKTVANGVLGSVSGMIQIIVSLIIAGILLVISGVGEHIRKFFRKMAGSRGDEFADTTIQTVGSVVKGIIGVALILALLHGLIFLLIGIPFTGILTLIIFVLCVLQIPVAIVTLPIILYIFSQYELTTAIIWTVVLLIAGLSDNILKPILLGKGAPVPMLVIFIGVIGGFIFSGFIGLFTGAIVLSIGYKLFVGWINSTDQNDTVNSPV